MSSPRSTAAATRFPTLLSPLDLGPFEVRNRIVMGSMHVGLEDTFLGLTDSGDDRRRHTFGHSTQGVTA